jgi:hypothetical protein
MQIELQTLRPFPFSQRHGSLPSPLGAELAVTRQASDAQDDRIARFSSVVRLGSLTTSCGWSNADAGCRRESKFRVESKPNVPHVMPPSLSFCQCAASANMTEDRIATANSSPIVMSASRTSFRLPKKIGKSGKVSREKNIALQKASRAPVGCFLSVARFGRDVVA